MINFDFSEKGLGLTSPPHLAYDFSRKIFLMLYSFCFNLLFLFYFQYKHTIFDRIKLNYSQII